MYIYVFKDKKMQKCVDTFVLASMSIKHLWKQTQVGCPQGEEVNEGGREMCHCMSFYGFGFLDELKRKRNKWVA